MAQLLDTVISGNLDVTTQLQVEGTAVFHGGLTGSLEGTASKAITASYTLDSDKLGGKAASQYASASHTHDDVYVTAAQSTASIEAFLTSSFTNLSQTGEYLTASIGGTTRTVQIVSASKAVNADTAISASQAENSNKLGGKAASEYASASHTHAYVTAAQVTASINSLVSVSGSTWSADTKVTSAANHYKPGISGSQGGNNSTYVHAITLDDAGHVTAVSTTNTSSIKAGDSVKLNGQAASYYAVSSSTAAALDTKVASTGGTISGDLTVQGNITVGGSASYVNTVDLLVKDKLILIASGSTDKAAADGAGVAIQTASAATIADAEKGAARIQYVSASNRFTSSVNFQAPTFVGALSGNASTATKLVNKTSGSATVPVYISGGVPVAITSYSGTATSASRAVSAADSDKLGGKAASQYASASHTHNYTTTANVNTIVSGAFTAFEASGNLTKITVGGTTKTVTVPYATSAGSATSASQAENSNKLGGKAAAQYASSSHTHAYATAAQVTASINSLVSVSGSTWAANTKVTSVGNHYTPAEDTASALTANASGATAAWSIDVVKGVTVKRDAKGHVVGVTVTSGKVPGNPNTDRYVATASFASTGSNGANGVKMTLTRQGSDTTAVAATIPVASTTAAGVVTGAQVTKLNNAESKPLSIYHPNSGCLVTTNLTTASSVMVDFLVEGNGYSGNYPILSQIQTYYYITGSTKSFQQTKGTNYGPVLGTPKLFALNTGYIALWFTQPSSYSTIRVVAHKNSESPAADHVSTITNAAAPTAFSTTASVTMQTKPSSDSSTTYAGHFAPSSSGAGTSGSSTARYYIKTISVDGKGHIVGVTTGNETVTNTDTKVTAVGNHYTPAQSTGKAATAGQALTGIGLDAAGHVTSVTSSTAITAALATNATQLGGKAASQYASASHTHAYVTAAQSSASIAAYISGAFTNFSASGSSTQIIVGGVTKKLTVPYATSAASSSKVNINQSLSATTYYPVWANAAGGYAGLYTTTGSLTWTPSTGHLYVSGTVSASNATLHSITLQYYRDTSNAIGLSWKNTSGSTVMQVCGHNTANNIIINAAGASAVYTDAVGKYSLVVGSGSLTYNTYPILRSDNYTSYTVTKLGTGSSGTWPIGITGNAGSATKVTVSNWATNNTKYRIVWVGSPGSGSSNLYSTDKIFVMPQSGAIQANSFTGSLSGTATNATQLNGKAASQYASASHTHAYLPLAGGTLSLNSITGLIINKTNNTIPVIKYASGSITYGFIGFSGSKPVVALPSASTDTVSSYNEILHAGNYTSYTVTKLGSGSSGTWPIGITGNAKTATSCSGRINVTQYATADGPYYPVWANAAGGYAAIYTTTGSLSFLPKTGLLRVGAVVSKQVAGATTGTITLVPGQVTYIDTPTGAITIATSSVQSGYANIYHCQIKMGATLYSVTVPGTLVEGSALINKPSSTYDISILNNTTIITRT